MSFLHRTVLKSPISRAGGKTYDLEVSRRREVFSRAGVWVARERRRAGRLLRAQAFQRDISGDNYARDCRVK